MHVDDDNDELNTSTDRSCRPGSFQNVSNKLTTDEKKRKSNEPTTQSRKRPRQTSIDSMYSHLHHATCIPYVS